MYLRIMLKLSYSNDKASTLELRSVYGIPLEKKIAVMDLTKTEEVVQDTTPRYSGDLGDVETWDELQARYLC